MLATIWFLLVGVLFTGYLILDGFDLGVGVLSLFAKSEGERRIHIKAIGPVWDGNEVWLLTGGGALFAAFPPVYATAFEGFYVALMLVVAALIFRAVAIEFHNKVDSPGWRRVWNLAFGVGSLLAALLFGVAAGNVLRGIPINEDFMFTGTFVGLLNPYSLVVGAAALVLLTAHGASYMALKTEGELRERMGRWATCGFAVFLALFAVGYLWTLTGAVWRGEPGAWRSVYKLHLVTPLAVALVAANLLRLLKARRFAGAFFHSCLMIVCAMGFILVSLYPRLLPSSVDLAHSLTIYNASSSALTLKVMLAIALLGMPLVIGYQALIYWIFRGPVDATGKSY